MEAAMQQEIMKVFLHCGYKVILGLIDKALSDYTEKITRTSSSHWEVSAAVKGVFECKYDNKNFNKNITYFICKMTWLHVWSLSNYWCG